MRRTLVVLSWLAGLAAAAGALLAAGRGALAGPDVAHPSTWSAWASGRDPVDAAVAVLRTGLLAVTLYLLAVTLLGLLARAVALPRLVAGLEIAGGPLVRRVLAGAAGAGLALTTLAPAVATAQTAPPATAVMRLLDERPPPARTTTTVATPPPTVAPPAATREPAQEILVEPGDSFWSIARRHVTDRAGREPSEREIARFWRKLIAANTDRLAVAGNPDLLFPNQALRLPDE
ncbi:MAG TPA: LysM domain-containing protein [Acidimicrobiales bacterium]|nr:LysM domain-containing protein [Acidimicrobiales bacterium]